MHLLLTLAAGAAALWVLGWTAFYVVAGAAHWWGDRAARREAHRRRVLENRAVAGDMAAADELGWWHRPPDY